MILDEVTLKCVYPDDCKYVLLYWSNLINHSRDPRKGFNQMHIVAFY